MHIQHVNLQDLASVATAHTIQLQENSNKIQKHNYSCYVIYHNFSLVYTVSRSNKNQESPSCQHSELKEEVCLQPGTDLHIGSHWMILTMTMSWWKRFKTLRDPGWWWMLTLTSRNAVQLAIIGICRIGWCWWIHNVCLFFRQVTTLQIVDITCACAMKHLRHFVTSSSTVKQTTYIKNLYPLISICWSRTWSKIKWYQIDQPHWRKTEPPNIHISFTWPYLQETPWPSLHIFGAGHAYSKGSMKYSM